jgi:hypothetical protein
MRLEALRASEGSVEDNSQPRPVNSLRPLSARQAAPPAGGRQDHDAMRAAAMRPVIGPASTDVLAANGGLNLPGGDPVAVSKHDVPTSAAVYEPIPGEYDRTTVTHREPGAMATVFGDATPSPDPHDWLDEATAHDRMIEGGGEDHGQHHTEGYRKR